MTTVHTDHSRLSTGEVTGLLEQLRKPWQVVDAVSIRRVFNFADFMDAMVFVNDVASIADAYGHHPHIEIQGSTVVITLTTTECSGLSPLDFIVAKQIEHCC